MSFRTLLHSLCIIFLTATTPFYAGAPSQREVKAALTALSDAKATMPTRQAAAQYSQTISRKTLQDCLNPSIAQRVLKKPSNAPHNLVAIKHELNALYTALENLAHVTRHSPLLPFQAAAIKTLFKDLSAKHETLKNLFLKLQKIAERPVLRDELAAHSPHKRHSKASSITHPTNGRVNLGSPLFFSTYFEEYVQMATNPNYPVKALQNPPRYPLPLIDIIGTYRGNGIMAGGFQDAEQRFPEWLDYAFPLNNSKSIPHSSPEFIAECKRRTQFQSTLVCSFYYFINRMKCIVTEKKGPKKIVLMHGVDRSSAYHFFAQFLTNRDNNRIITHVLTSLKQHGLHEYAILLYEFLTDGINREVAFLSHNIPEDVAASWAAICHVPATPSPRTPKSRTHVVHFNNGSVRSKVITSPHIAAH